MTNEFQATLNRYLDKITAREPFAFYRYADGELALMHGKPIGADTQASRVDHWQAPNRMTLLGQDLRKILSVQDRCFHFAIPCVCCDKEGHDELRNIISSPNVIPANLFINANYKFFLSFLLNIKNLPISVVINETANEWRLPFPVTSKMTVPYDCVNYYETHKTDILGKAREFAKSMKFQVVFVSSGPMSEILIFHMWNANPYNTYVDVGSALDIFIFNKPTRPYMDLNTSYARQECSV